jgi:hypothetical protein
MLCCEERDGVEEVLLLCCALWLMKMKEARPEVICRPLSHVGNPCGELRRQVTESENARRLLPAKPKRAKTANSTLNFA